MHENGKEKHSSKLSPRTGCYHCRQNQSTEEKNLKGISEFELLYASPRAPTKTTAAIGKGNKVKMEPYKRVKWDDDDDELLKCIVQQHGAANWKRVSDRFNSQVEGERRKTGKQCRERWKYHVDPVVNKNEWSEAERQLLFQLHQVHANNWAEISKQLTGRTDNAIKNMFYCELSKALRDYNRNHHGNQRILRTRKSLIKDKQITVQLSMCETKQRSPSPEPIEEHPPSDATSNLVANIPDAFQTTQTFPPEYYWYWLLCTLSQVQGTPGYGAFYY